MECKVRESKHRLIGKRPNEREESDHLPLWLKEWYQLRKNNVKSKELIELNAPNTFPVHSFQNTLRHKRVVTDSKRNPVRDPETGWIKIKERHEHQYPQWSQSWRAAQQEFEEANPRKIYQGPGPPPGKGYVVVVCGVRLDPRTKKSKFLLCYLPKEDVPRVKRKQIDHSKLKELFKTHGEYVRRFADNFFRGTRSIWEKHIGYFATEFRAEDLESILWEEILHGAGVNKEALSFALKGFLHDKMQTKGKYGDVDFVSLPNDIKLERLDIDRLRRKWETTPAISEPDINDEAETTKPSLFEPGLLDVPLGRSWGMWPDQTKWHKAWVKALNAEPCFIMHLEKPWNPPVRCEGKQNREDYTEDLMAWVIRLLQYRFKCTKETDYEGQHYLPGQIWDDNSDTPPKVGEYWKRIRTGYPNWDFDYRNKTWIFFKKLR